MLEIHRQEVIVEKDGELALDHLPFNAGETVEVIIRSQAAIADKHQKLRGSVLQYQDPFAPVAADDWDVLK